jgi:heme-degrading monooxygenase HmoA
VNNQSTIKPTNPVTLINCLTVKPGMMDQFIEAQRAFALAGHAGLNSGRMYRSTDGRTAILVSRFASAAAQQEVLQSDAFKEHLDKLRPMVESSNPAPYEVAYAYGDFA